jgi:exodeoxyribonuclease VII large subunit
MSIRTLSVSEIVNSVKQNLESEFRNIVVEGEVSNLSGSAAGHFYFTLSDNNSGISCAIFKMDALRNPLIRRIKNGDKIHVSGSIGVYAKRGTFQIIIKRISPVGKGDLKAEFEKLKKRFIDKGYFEQDHKKEIPLLAKKIAVITALKGAALQDFLNIMKRRTVWHNIVIIPAVVQGDDCPRSVISGIDKAEKLGDIDVLVITRGGGSLEDLWGFNNEKLVERAFKCNIPIVSAVGHQVDFSLLDFVSDLRCETPSSAAEVLSHEHTRLKNRLFSNAKNLRLLTIELKSIVEKKLHKIHPLSVLNLIKNNLYTQQKKLESLNLCDKLDPVRVMEYSQNIDDLVSRLASNVDNKAKSSKNELEYLHARIKGLNPRDVLKRGYSILSDKNGKILTSSKEFDKISVNETLKINFSDGVGKVQKLKD